jgi:hypothetical protein
VRFQQKPEIYECNYQRLQFFSLFGVEWIMLGKVMEVVRLLVSLVEKSFSFSCLEDILFVLNVEHMQRVEYKMF